MSSRDEITVEGHPLPPELVRSIEAGIWQSLRTSKALQTLFGEEPDSGVRFLDTDEIVATNRSWVHETGELWLGTGSENIDPAASLIIAVLGFDRPIALDYRFSPPPVKLLTEDGRWTSVARDVEELIRRLSSPSDESAYASAVRRHWGALLACALGESQLPIDPLRLVGEVGGLPARNRQNHEFSLTVTPDVDSRTACVETLRWLGVVIIDRESMSWPEREFYFETTPIGYAFTSEPTPRFPTAISVHFTRVWRVKGPQLTTGLRIVRPTESELDQLVNSPADFITVVSSDSRDRTLILTKSRPLGATELAYSS